MEGQYFEWVARKIIDGEDQYITRHYLVDPCGQVRAEVDEPYGNRLGYIADIYFLNENRVTVWSLLSVAKLHVENAYIDELKRKPKPVTKRSRKA